MRRNPTRRSTEPVFTEPQRLHKVLAQCGYGSLRGLEELIIAGRITVNRQPAEVGQKVGPNDQIRINGELVRLRFAPPRTRVLLYHKPAGEIVSRADPEGRPTVFEKLPRLGGAKWIAVGRLDFNSEGLLLFTTSGELANRLMHPRYEVEREYAARIVGTLTPEQERALLEGVALDDGIGRVTSLADGGGEGTNHWYKLTLPEGRNREVRRLFEALGLTVSRLIRTRYGVVAMPPQLKRGQMAELEPAELARLLEAAGMNAAGNGGREGNAAGRPAHSGEAAQSTPQQESGDDDNQPMVAAVEVESDEALDEVDGNRAPAPLPPEGGGQRQGRPGGRGEHRPPGGRGGHGPQGGRGGHGPQGGRGGHGPRGGNRGGNRGGQQGGQDPGRR
ncbi:MAG TPA: pseudouridine synthase [Casimicrobiaceae bacterium]|jgi:23S rRNA pseudouridine2605 synthase